MDSKTITITDVPEDADWRERVLAMFYEELRRALGADAGELVDDGDLFEIVETVREQRDEARITVVKVLKRFGCGQGDGVKVGALPEDGAWPDALIVEHAERIAMERFDEMVGAKIRAERQRDEAKEQAVHFMARARTEGVTTMSADIELVALLHAARPFVHRAAVKAKHHAQDQADAAELLPRIEETLAKHQRPAMTVSEDGKSVRYGEHSDRAIGDEKP